MEKKNKILLGLAGFGVAVYLVYKFRPLAKTTAMVQVGSEKQTLPDNSYSLILAKQGTRLREQPNTTSNILDTFDEGVMLYPDETRNMSDGLWYHVSEGGWVRNDAVTLPSSLPSIDDLLITSKSGSKVSSPCQCIMAPCNC